MHVLIINPNSSESMTRAIQSAADHFVGNAYEVTCKLTPGAPEFIETYEDQLKTAPSMIRMVREGEKTFDGFIVACHCDPNLDAIKEITRKPVVGIGEASMKMASMLGHRFSVVSTCSHSIPNKEALIRKYHLEDVGSVWAPSKEITGNDAQKALETARMAIQEDQAEVIVLGCAGMAGLDKQIQNALNAPVLDGVVCALIVISGLIQYGVSTSKVRRYNPGDHSCD